MRTFRSGGNGFGNSLWSVDWRHDACLACMMLQRWRTAEAGYSCAKAVYSSSNCAEVSVRRCIGFGGNSAWTCRLNPSDPSYIQGILALLSCSTPHAALTALRFALLKEASSCTRAHHPSNNSDSVLILLKISIAHRCASWAGKRVPGCGNGCPTAGRKMLEALALPPRPPAPLLPVELPAPLPCVYWPPVELLEGPDELAIVVRGIFTNRT